MIPVQPSDTHIMMAIIMVANISSGPGYFELGAWRIFIICVSIVIRFWHMYAVSLRSVIQLTTESVAFDQHKRSGLVNPLSLNIPSTEPSSSKTGTKWFACLSLYRYPWCSLFIRFTISWHFLITKLYFIGLYGCFELFYTVDTLQPRI